MLAVALRRRTADGTDRGEVYRDALRGVGVLNYENSVISGEHRFLRRFLEQYPEATVLDVGANAGQYARSVREHGPNATIHAFEPHPVSYAALQAIAADIRITPHGFGLSDQPGEIEFFDYADEAGSQHASVYRDVIETVHRRSAEARKVRCETLDTVAPRLGLSHIGLLKIDTEGHELAVLKGARGLLQNSVQTFPDSGGKQRPIVSTLVRAILRRLRGRVWGVLHGYDCRNPPPSLGQQGEHQLDRA